MKSLLRRTKIVATFGPATDDPAVLTDMVRAGVDVVRLNFSHGAVADHARRVELVREAARQAGRYVGVLGDLQGPKIRIDRFAGGKVQLADGAEFTLDAALAADAGSEAMRSASRTRSCRRMCSPATCCCSTTGRSACRS